MSLYCLAGVGYENVLQIIAIAFYCVRVGLIPAVLCFLYFTDNVISVIAFEVLADIVRLLGLVDQFLRIGVNLSLCTGVLPAFVAVFNVLYNVFLCLNCSLILHARYKFMDKQIMVKNGYWNYCGII